MVAPLGGWFCCPQTAPVIVRFGTNTVGLIREKTGGPTGVLGRLILGPAWRVMVGMFVKFIPILISLSIALAVPTQAEPNPLDVVTWLAEEASQCALNALGCNILCYDVISELCTVICDRYASPSYEGPATIGDQNTKGLFMFKDYSSSTKQYYYSGIGISPGGNCYQ